MQRKTVSQVTTSTDSLARQITSLKQAEGDQTARLNSDTVGLLGNADPDQRFFISPVFKNMRLVQVANGNQTYGTLAFMPPEQNGTLEDRYYDNATPVILDKAGSGSGSSTTNLIRTGTTPAGYYGAGKVLVQKRYKVFTISEDYPDFYVYFISVRDEPKGYALQADERFDGGFYPGSIHQGVERPYGTTFPVDDQGRYQYNDDPYTEDGWSGATYTVHEDDSTKPVVTSFTPIGFNTATDSAGGFMTLTGKNFTGCGFVMIGPFKPDFYPGLGGNESTGLEGATFRRLIVSDTSLNIVIPPGLVVGKYFIYVIGRDGQIGVCPTQFVVS